MGGQIFGVNDLGEELVDLLTEGHRIGGQGLEKSLLDETQVEERVVPNDDWATFLDSVLVEYQTRAGLGHAGRFVGSLDAIVDQQLGVDDFGERAPSKGFDDISETWMD